MITKVEILERIDRVKEKDYHHGVIAIAGQPTWAGAEGFTYRNDTIRVCPTVSSLDVRARLLERDEVTWLILLTDLADRDLGFGIRAHLVGNRVYETDPWRAVGARFKASSTETRLVQRARMAGKEYINALLRSVQDANDLPAAPTGMLTQDLLFQNLANRHLGVPAGDALSIDSILTWSSGKDVHQRIATCREALGIELSDDLLDWVAARCGVITPAARSYLKIDKPQELLPLGLITSAIAQADPRHAPWTHLRVRTQESFGRDQLRLWSEISERTFTSLKRESATTAERVLRRAEALLDEYEASEFAAVSPILNSGFNLRLDGYSRALGIVLQTPDGETFNGEDLQTCEGALTDLVNHQRALDPAHEDSTRAAEASMRLVRWLALPHEMWTTLSVAAIDYRSSVGWVDRALNTVWTGSRDPGFSARLEMLARRIHRHRIELDRRFAKLLSDATAAAPSVPGIERIIQDVVVPLAKKKPVSLVVIDGMGVSAATAILDSVEERLPALSMLHAQQYQPMALAVMPSLTTHSRTSLFTGHISSGGQAEELTGFSQQLRNHGLTGRLFHKKEIESSVAGARISGDVHTAVTDTANINVFACVLNTIDDALAKSDPMGTTWNLANVAHLASVLTESYQAGRTIVLVSDHGHIVDRRAGTKSDVTSASSARSRDATGAATEQEILVSGDRVVGGSAILAVDEALRYTARSAGYHGGGSLAEMIIPITVLDSDPDELANLGWSPAPPQAPMWWRERLGRSLTSSSAHRGPSAPKRQSKPKAAKSSSDDAALFEIPTPKPREKSAGLLADSGTTTPGGLLAVSQMFKTMRNSVPAVHLSTDVLLDLVDALADAPQNTITEDSAASLLSVSKIKLNGAFPLVMRILNVEQYPVIYRDLAARKVSLDIALLKDQFDIQWEPPE